MPYTYLLGLYLGDGCLAEHPRGVYRLRIACANAYPGLVRQCEQAITQVLPVKGQRNYSGPRQRGGFRPFAGAIAILDGTTAQRGDR